MVQLRNKYEEEVQHRNARGIQLIERNEEVCIFYEKVNIQGKTQSSTIFRLIRWVIRAARNMREQ